MLELLKKDGKLSLTKILCVVGYSTFILVSLGLAITGKTWGNYGEFALATGGAIVVRFGDKWLNTKRDTSKVGEN